jgi:hypothetical protein
VEDAPTERSEQPLAHEERYPEHREQAGQDDQDQSAAGKRGHAPDLAGDRRELGLRQIDMGLDQGDRRIARGQELGSKAARAA